MSLMNDMLRDLDRQGRRGNHGADTSEALLANSSLARKQRRGTWLPAVLSFTLVTAVVLFRPWSFWSDSSAVADVDIEEAVVEIAVEDAPVEAEVASVQPLALDTALSINREEQQNNELAAVDARTVALQLDEEVAAVDDGNVASNSAAIEVESGRIEDSSQQGVALAQIPPTAAPEASSSSGQASDVQVVRQPVGVTERPSEVSVVRSPEWRDKHAAEQAQQLLDSGREHAAREQLRAFIAEHPAPVVSAGLLASLYLRSGELARVESLLGDAHYLSGPVQSRLRAQVLMARGDNSGALTILEENLGSAQRDEEYRALLAAVQHKQGAYGSSANQYRRLLEDFGERPVYWLGLALALDAQGENYSAVEAYRRARFGQQSAVLDYIDQRIAALVR